MPPGLDETKKWKNYMTSNPGKVSTESPAQDSLTIQPLTLSLHD